MKVLIITKNYTPSTIPDAKRFSGISNYLDSEGYNVTVITETKQINQDNNIKIKSCRKIGRDSLGMLERLINHFSFMVQAIFKSFSVGKVDVVISTSPPLFNLVSGRIIAKFKRSKYIIDLRDIWPDVFEQTEVLNQKSFVYKFFDRIARKAYKHADIIAVVTPGKKALLEEKFPKYSSKIHLLSNGFNKSILEYENVNEIAENFENSLNIVYTGKIGLAQDLDSYLQLAENNLDNSKLKFHIFGSGRGEEALIQTIKDKELSNVVFYGYRSEAEIATALKLSQISYVSLVNDKLIDSIPSKLYESLAFGCPVLLSAVGDSQDLVEKLEFGLTSKPQNFEELENNFYILLESYDTIIARKLFVQDKMIKEYSREVTARKYVEIISALLEEKDI